MTYFVFLYNDYPQSGNLEDLEFMSKSLSKLVANVTKQLKKFPSSNNMEVYMFDKIDFWYIGNFEYEITNNFVYKPFPEALKITVE